MGNLWLEGRVVAASVGLLAISVSSCSSMGQMFSIKAEDEAGFVQVDDLMARVERVHVACELGSQHVAESVASLTALVGPEFRGDPLVAFEELIGALELSERQAQDLSDHYGPMQESADGVYQKWQSDLEAFTSDVMRKHSQDRMLASQQRYQAILDRVGPALEEYHAFNAAVRDQALYLGNDFSADSVAVITKELRALHAQSKELRSLFDACTKACQLYVRKAALRGQISPRSGGKNV